MSNAVGPHSSDAEIVAAIASVSEALRGPMSDAERALMVADRKDMRAELARRQKQGR